MSTFIGCIVSAAAFFVGPGMNYNEDILQQVNYRQTFPYLRQHNLYNQTTDILWPRSGFVGMLGSNLASAGEHMTRLWAYDLYQQGHQGRTAIEGITRDSAGTALGACTVQLFNTATGLLVDTGTSDAGGYYRLTDPNGVACFAVAYKIGTPVMGTTINTLTGV
jgi:hypothetical protein